MTTLSNIKAFFVQYKLHILSFTLVLLFAGVTFTFAAYPLTQFSPGETLDPGLANPACTPGSSNCSVDIATDITIGDTITDGEGGAVLFLEDGGLLGNDSSTFFWDNANKRLGLKTSSPTASLHILASQTLVPGDPGTSGVVGETTYTGTGLDDAVFGGEYLGDTECTIGAGVSGNDPDKFIWGYIGDGPGCSGGDDTGIVITPGTPQDLGDTGVTVTFASNSGHILIVMDPALDNYWSALVTPGTPSTPDSYIAGDDPFLIMNDSDVTLFKIANDGTITFNDVAYTFPGADGTAGQALATNGSGTLSWTTISGDDCGNEYCFTIDEINRNMFSGINAGDALGDNYGNNLFIGLNAGQYTTTGSQNVFLGQYAGRDNTTGNDNVFVGLVSGAQNIDGQENTFLGTNTGYSNTSGSNNVFLGTQAGYSNTTGDDNIFSGYLAGQNNTTGSQNIFSGSQSGFSNTTGSGNIALGYSAGDTITTTNYNTIIGFNADVLNNTIASSIALGANAVADIDNQFALSDSITSWKFSGDSYTLPTAGAINTSGFLSNDGLGGLTWATPTSGVTTLAPIGASPNANGATISGTTLNLEPASALFGGVITTDSQVIAGSKTFSSQVNITTGSSLVLGELSTTTGAVLFRNNTNDNTLTLQSGISSGNFTLTLPTAQSTGTQALVNDGTGTLSWASFGTGNGNVTGSGTAPRIPYWSSATALTDDANFTRLVGRGILLQDDASNHNVFIGNTTGVAGATGGENIAFGTNAMDALTSGDNNIAMGDQAGSSITNGLKNVLIGNFAGTEIISEQYGTYIGSEAGRRMRGYSNVAIGQQAMLGSGTPANNTGQRNVSIGGSSLAGVESGSYNIALGYATGTSITSGSDNIFMGQSAGLSLTGAASYNIFLGYESGKNRTGGSSNVFIGPGANSGGIGTGGTNTGIGNSVLSVLTSGSDNVAVGSGAGSTLTTGTQNTLIGVNSLTTTVGTTGAIALGYGASAAANEFAISNSITNWKFSGDSYTLPIAGAISTSGFLSNDGAGVLSWAELIGRTTTNYRLARETGMPYREENVQVEAIPEFDADGGANLGGSHALIYVKKYNTLFSTVRNSTPAFIRFNNPDDLTDYDYVTVTGVGSYAYPDQIIYSSYTDKLYMVLSDNYVGGNLRVVEIDPETLAYSLVIDDSFGGNPAGYPTITIIGNELFAVQGYYNPWILKYSLDTFSQTGSVQVTDADNGFHSLETDGTYLYAATTFNSHSQRLVKVDPATMTVAGNQTYDFDPGAFPAATSGVTDDILVWGNYIYMPTESLNVGYNKVAKVNKNDLSDFTMLTFDADTTAHQSIMTDGRYIYFSGPGNTLGRFDPETNQGELYDASSFPGTDVNELATDGSRIFFAGFDTYPVSGDGFVGRIPFFEGIISTFTLDVSGNQMFVVDKTNSRLGIGVSAPSYKLDVNTNVASYVARFFNDGNLATQSGILIQGGLDDQSQAGPSTLIQFNDGDGTSVGSITFGNSLTAYNTSSDVRLKDPVDDETLVPSLDMLGEIKIHNFTWKADTSESKRVFQGVFAQELYDIYPIAVTTNGDDGTGDLALGVNPWMVDYSKLTPLIIQSIQDLNLKIEGIGDDIVSETNTFAEALRRFFENTTNGIRTLFANKIQTHELCVDDVCVTRDQFLQMIGNNGGQVNTEDGNNDGGGGGSDLGGEGSSGSETGGGEVINEIPVDDNGENVGENSPADGGEGVDDTIPLISETPPVDDTPPIDDTPPTDDTVVDDQMNDSEESAPEENSGAEGTNSEENQDPPASGEGGENTDSGSGEGSII